MGVGRILTVALCFHPVAITIIHSLTAQVGYTVTLLSVNQGTVMETSLRNHLKGKVIEIVKGGAVSEIEVETSAGIIASVITTRSVERLGLKVGDEVFAVIKASEVGIEKP